MSTIEFVVEPDEGGTRLDKLVVARVTGLGRRRATELFAKGRVTIDGKRVQKGDPAPAGATVRVALGLEGGAVPEPDAPLDVRHETSAYVVVSKPAGQPSVPLSGEETGTLANALVGRYPEMAEVGFSRREPGLIHRLDTQTSGLLVAARTSAAFERLRRAMSAGEIDKRYLAIVSGEGLGESGTIDEPLVQDDRRPERVLVVATDARGARRAVTRWRVRERGQRFTLVEVSAARAFRHQIRAHLASIDHPIAGDAIYGGPAAPQLGPRHALHASYVAWAGDATLPGFAVEDPLPPELAALITG